MKIIKLNIVSLLVILGLGMSVGLSQSPCTDYTPCIEGGPCCNVWNACNYQQSTIHSNAGCPGSVIDANGCDLACTPIDSGVLFLLLGGATLGGMMLARRRQEGFELIKH